jgi:hypothetical protein
MQNGSRPVKKSPLNPILNLYCIFAIGPLIVLNIQTLRFALLIYIYGGQFIYPAPHSSQFETDKMLCVLKGSSYMVPSYVHIVCKCILCNNDASHLHAVVKVLHVNFCIISAPPCVSSEPTHSPKSTAGLTLHCLPDFKTKMTH